MDPEAWFDAFIRREIPPNVNLMSHMQSDDIGYLENRALADPQNPRCMVIRVLIWLRRKEKGQEEYVIRLCLRAIRCGDVDAMIALGIINETMERYHEAREQYELAMNKGSIYAMVCFGYICYIHDTMGVDDPLSYVWKAYHLGDTYAACIIAQLPDMSFEESRQILYPIIEKDAFACEILAYRTFMRGNINDDERVQIRRLLRRACHAGRITSIVPNIKRAYDHTHDCQILIDLHECAVECDCANHTIKQLSDAYVSQNNIPGIIQLYANDPAAGIRVISTMHDGNVMESAVKHAFTLAAQLDKARNAIRALEEHVVELEFAPGGPGYIETLSRWNERIASSCKS